MKCNIIVAVSKNFGIGKNGTLPWRLKNEMRYFANQTKSTVDKSKKNAVIMGRKTWQSIPSNHRPLASRFNIILSRQAKCFTEENNEHIHWLESLPEALKLCESLEHEIETIWIIGGESIYKEALNTRICDKIYMTEIFHDFECDTFFPEIIPNTFNLISTDEKIQEENNIKYQYKIFGKIVS